MDTSVLVDRLRILYQDACIFCHCMHRANHCEGGECCSVWSFYDKVKAIASNLLHEISNRRKRRVAAATQVYICQSRNCRPAGRRRLHHLKAKISATRLWTSCELTVKVLLLMSIIESLLNFSTSTHAHGPVLMTVEIATILPPAMEYPILVTHIQRLDGLATESSQICKRSPLFWLQELALSG